MTKEPLDNLSGILDTTATIPIIVQSSAIIHASEQVLILRVELYEIVDSEEVLIDTRDKSLTITYD